MAVVMRDAALGKEREEIQSSAQQHLGQADTFKHCGLGER
jgi:hypothetical protein